MLKGSKPKWETERRYEPAASCWNAASPSASVIEANFKESCCITTKADGIGAPVTALSTRTSTCMGGSSLAVLPAKGATTRMHARMNAKRIASRAREECKRSKKGRPACRDILRGILPGKEINDAIAKAEW